MAWKSRRKRALLVSLALIGSVFSGCEYDPVKAGANTPFRTKRPTGFAGKVPDPAQTTRQGGRALDSWRGKPSPFGNASDTGRRSPPRPSSQPAYPEYNPETGAEVIPQQYGELRPRPRPVAADPGMDTGPSVWGSMATPPSYRAQNPGSQPIITQRAALPAPPAVPPAGPASPPPGARVPPPSLFPGPGSRQAPPARPPGPGSAPTGPGTRPPPVQYAPNAQQLGFIWPVDGEISSVYGWRQGKPHTGLDLRAPNGTTIVASQAGKVIFSGQMKGYGNTIIVDHQNGFFTVYGHNQANLVKKSSGQKSTWVKRGQPIARVGQSGNATGPHVHFEIRRSNNPLDPMKFLPPKQFAMAR